MISLTIIKRAINKLTKKISKYKIKKKHMKYIFKLKRIDNHSLFDI